MHDWDGGGDSGECVTVFSGECMVKVRINIHSYVHTSS